MTIPAIAPPDKDLFGPFKLLAVIDVLLVYKLEVRGTLVPAIGILIWIGYASTYMPLSKVGITYVPLPVVFWSKMLSISIYVVVGVVIRLWQKAKYGVAALVVVSGQP